MALLLLGVAFKAQAAHSPPVTSSTCPGPSHPLTCGECIAKVHLFPPITKNTKANNKNQNTTKIKISNMCAVTAMCVSPTMRHETP
jgi:hypothetical protein